MPDSTAVRTRRPIEARNGRNKIHWVVLFEDRMPAEGEPIPDDAGARTLCSRHYFAKGWTRVPYQDEARYDERQWCQGCC